MDIPMSFYENTGFPLGGVRAQCCIDARNTTTSAELRFSTDCAQSCTSNPFAPNCVTSCAGSDPLDWRSVQSRDITSFVIDQSYNAADMPNGSIHEVTVYYGLIQLVAGRPPVKSSEPYYTSKFNFTVVP
jgi:hypothetical protein